MESVQQNAVLNPDDGIVQVRMLGGFPFVGKVNWFVWSGRTAPR